MDFLLHVLLEGSLIDRVSLETSHEASLGQILLPLLLPLQLYRFELLGDPVHIVRFLLLILGHGDHVILLKVLINHLVSGLYLLQMCLEALLP